MTQIHPTSIISREAEIGKNVIIGPYCQVDKGVTLEDNVSLMSNVIITGQTKIGKGSQVYPYAVLGMPPQHLGHKGEPTELHIGENTIIREHVTAHTGTVFGGGITKIGNHCFLMVGSHVAHDCHVGNHVIFANNATLGGHVIIDDYVILGGLSAIHQRVRIGKHALIGGMAGVEGDVIPFGSVMGNRARLYGLNIIGLKRRGYSRQSIHDLRSCYRLLFAQEGTLSERLEDVSELFKDHLEAMEIINFVRQNSDRSLCMPKFTEEEIHVTAT